MKVNLHSSKRNLNVHSGWRKIWAEGAETSQQHPYYCSIKVTTTQSQRLFSVPLHQSILLTLHHQHHHDYYHHTLLSGFHVFSVSVVAELADNCSDLSRHCVYSRFLANQRCYSLSHNCLFQYHQRTLTVTNKISLLSFVHVCVLFILPYFLFVFFHNLTA